MQAAEPIVIAHRGASGYLPEHTLAAKALAHGMGADFLEQDVVLSRDGVALVLHDIYLEATTNVEAVFPDRARDDGRFYAADFTLQEIKQLRAHERTDKEGEPVFHSPKTLDFHRQIGKNTGYIIHPEEILADNFALIMTNGKVTDTWLTEKMKSVIKTHFEHTDIVPAKNDNP